MNLKDIGKRIIHTFFAVWGLSGAMICIFSLVFSWNVLMVEFFLSMYGIAVLTSLTYVVFYSKKELDMRGLVKRFLIQYVLVMGIVVTISIMAEWIYPGYMIYAVAIVLSVTIIFIIIAAYEIYQTWRLAGVLNSKLKERRKED